MIIVLQIDGDVYKIRHKRYRKDKSTMKIYVDADACPVVRIVEHDIVVTQDYGVAAMALGKGAYAIHQSGKWYTDENIDQMLMERHLNKKARRASGKNHLRGDKRNARRRTICSFASPLKSCFLWRRHKAD